MPRLIHLNGPPAVGKSTLARRWVHDHPGTLNCDIDRLRTMIGGWDADFLGAGARIRTSALAMIGAYLRTGSDVVVPQLVVRPEELARFRGAATDAGATYVCVALTAEPHEVGARFGARALESPGDPLLRQLHAVVKEQGGDEALARTCRELDTLMAGDPSIARLPSTDPETTYAALVALVDQVAVRGR